MGYIKQTPNPNSLMFCFEGKVVNEKKAKKEILSVSGVKSVFFGDEFITINKEEDEDWDFLKPTILSIITALFVESELKKTKAPKKQNNNSKNFKDVESIINSKIRPSVQMDGGDVVLHSVSDDGVVLISMVGACEGCPSSTQTLKGGIERMLKHFCPFVTEVVKK